jgi:hypothetical protein
MSLNKIKTKNESQLYKNVSYFYINEGFKSNPNNDEVKKKRV